MFCFPVQQFVSTTILASVFQNPYTPLITMEMHPMTINAMDMNTMVNIVRDAFEGQDRHNPQLNPAFEIVHFLLGQASERITKTIYSFLPQPDRSSWLNMKVQFSEKLQLHIMAIGDNSGTSEAAPTNRMTCLADYLFKTIVDS